MTRQELNALMESGVPASADELRLLARHELRGKNLACWCPAGQPCHADVLLEVANRPDA